MGYIRFVLALSVAVSHAGLWTPMNAAHAVQLFFVISGYYMATGLAGTYKDRPLAFYANRALRLFPAYWVVALLTFAWLLAINYDWGAIHAFRGKVPLSGLIVLSNILLVGQDIVSLMQGGYTYLFVSPAWSIGMEIMFYALAPLLATLSTRKLIVITSVLFAALILASGPWQWSMGGMNFIADPKYYVWPLQLPFFTFGMLLARFGIEMPSGKIDKSLAELSYPIYLVHYPVMHFMALGKVQYLLFVLALSWLIVCLIERPMRRFRDAIRAHVRQPRGENEIAVASK